MAFQTIKLKNTNVAGNVPAADKLATAELVINLKDKKLFSKDADGAVFELNSASTTPGPLPPNDKQPGDLWFNENDNSLNYWDGSQWVQLEGSTGDPGVISVNGQTGTVVLGAADVGALPDTTPILWKEDSGALTPETAGIDLTITGSANLQDWVATGMLR